MKPSLPQGTRDFGPDVVRKRQYILNTIKSVFELYGFQPLETPAMENLETLMGKYGEEGDKLIFRILDSGNPFSKDFLEELLNLFKQLQEYFKSSSETTEFLKTHEIEFSNAENPFGNPIWELNPEVLADLFNFFIDNNKSAYDNLLSLRSEISGKALKYDLTIPFARYVAMNHGRLTFPFKRYQIQPVWRGDKPQRGRYREFYQCDADVVGSKAVLNETELTSIYLSTFRKLGVDVTININNRKVLQGIADYCGCSDKLIDLTIALDKLDKIGIDKVKAELIERGVPEDRIHLIFECLNINENDLTEQMCLDCINVSKYELSVEEQRIACLKYKCWDKDISSGMKGCDELLEVFDHFPNEPSLKFDISLARGLNYYTGTIFEVKAKNVKIGSIGGGGRYDDLTGLFGVPNIPGVGISFGVDRIYDVLDELKLFPDTIEVGTKVLFFNLGAEESNLAYQLLQQLRQKGIASEIYHEPTKFDKQFKYAEKKNIPFAIIIGSKEIETKTCVIKDLRSGEQRSVAFEVLPEFSFV